MVLHWIYSRVNEHNESIYFWTNYFLRMDNLNWDAVLWIGGGFATVIVLLLTIIAYFIRQDRLAIEKRESGQDIRMDKHETWILDNQEETKKMLQQQAVVLANNTTAIQILKELVIKHKR
jgi:hypothetical protein